MYKLQVKPHQDGFDGEPAAIFNAGPYEDGELYLIDLDIKFK
jgi:hypothetical protein